MKTTLLLGFACVLAMPLHASTILQQGMFASDQVLIIPFNVLTAGTVTLRTYGYAGGWMRPITRSPPADSTQWSRYSTPLGIS